MPYANMRSADAHLFLHADSISLYSDGSLAGLQFELVMEAGNLPGMMLLSPHHELVYVREGNKIKAMIFSLNNTPLPAGNTKLIAFHDEVKTLEWGDVVAGNRNALEVPVHLHKDAATGIDKLITGIDGLKAYPNPASNQLWVEFANYIDAPVEVSLVNAFGQQTAKQTVHDKGVNVLTFDVENLKPGIYFLRLQTSSGVITEKIIIE